MPLPDWSGLRLPAIAAPMFLTSGPDLVVEACNNGVVGTFPALNQRTTDGFGAWLDEIEARRAPGAAPYGVNLIVHRSNPRLAADLEVVVRRRVPLVITSLGAAREVVAEVQGYGGVVFHDVINRRHGEKAAAAGVDGLIAVAAGAGGHGGTISPFALLAELRQVFAGTLVLSGALNTGAQVAAARLMGADMGYLGTRFIATREAMVPEAQKQMILAARARDILYTPAISGVAANFLRPSIEAAGLDPDHLPPAGRMNLEKEAKAWSRVWSAGQGVGGIDDVPSVAELCERLAAEYRAAMQAAAGDPFAR
ncbi:2-nitropropane dioxygenase-like protein [Oceanicola granulosus HTCC2516]|uniref:2-nitropropane dioxygenase-like protein n=1 Tax=Oceanicola granulosus (strain ATCC BAA-861 / DSM 15982 / KCTC 12143 / HTCC2516) TaxID=314256 RepID=Q2CE15_OCEGH|nr:nitronate monooxygenase family protein [Oceanicola granulosus]EAR50923.1 2-nitropropane dioxygenase-like protein [Oceanicola granulosus HTCC2516]